MLFQEPIKLPFIKAGIVFLFLFLFSASIPAQKLSTKRKSLEAKRKELQQQIAENKRILEQTKAQESNTLNQLNVISTQIVTRELIINNISQEAFELSIEIEGQRKAIQTLQNDLATLKKDYADNIAAAYKKRNSNDAFMYLLDSKNINQAFKRLRYLNQYGKYREQQARLILNTQRSIIEEINNMIGIKQQKVSLMGEKKKEKVALEADKKTEAVILGKLQQKVKTIREQLADQEKSAKRLNQAIDDLIAKEIAAARKAEEARIKAAEKKAAAKNKNKTPEKKETPTATSYLSEADQKMSVDFAGNKGRLPWPVEQGKVIGTFGAHPHATLKGVMTHNNGIDIATREGNTVKAVFKGTIKGIFPIPGMGRVVLVNHGAYFTVYARLDNVLVSIGQTIEAKQTLGTVAPDPEEQNPRVHFEIYKQRDLVNPQVWLRPSP